LPGSSSFKSMSLVKSETAHRTIIKVVTSKEGAGGSREREQEVAEGEHGEATSEQGRAEREQRDERSVSARAKLRKGSRAALEGAAREARVSCMMHSNAKPWPIASNRPNAKGNCLSKVNGRMSGTSDDDKCLSKSSLSPIIN